MLPIGMRVLALLQEGVDSGEFRAVDPAQFLPTAIGSIVHYFLTAPLRQRFLKLMPMPEPSIEDRRAAVLDFIAAALFSRSRKGNQAGCQNCGRRSASHISQNPRCPVRKGNADETA